MKRLTSPTHVSRAAVIVPLEAKTSQLLAARTLAISKMSGYPSAIHSIGRLQHAIKLTSFKDLLESLHKLGVLARITAEVIESMDGTKVDRYQMDRTEIITYVKNITSTMDDIAFSEDQIDLIAHLITSFEANPQAWVLAGGEGEVGLHTRMMALYTEVLSSSEGADLPAYSPSSGIVKFVDLPQFSDRMKKAKRRKGKAEVEDSASMDSGSILESEITLYRFAATRVLDHVYQLLLDKDAWYNFVSPRTKADVTNNLERAKSLRLFAVYCHHLLVYYQFFAIESFLKSYDLVQQWIIHFPPLETQTLADLEGLIRKYDLLDARGDVASLLDSFSGSGSTDLKALVYPREFVAPFGLASTIDKLTESAGKYSLTGDLSNLADLDRPQYMPLVSGIAASELDITYKVAEVLLVGKVVKEEVRRAVSVLLPSMTGAMSEHTMDRFKSLTIKASLPFIIPHAATWNVTAGAEKGVYSNSLHLDSAAPLFSSSYHEFVRDELRLKMTTDRLISMRYAGFTDLQLIDFDKAKDLRDIVQTNWKTFAPSFMHTGDRHYTYESFASAVTEVKNLIEMLSGRNYETIIIEMSLLHIRKMWATFLSGFALLYVNPNEASNVKLTDTTVKASFSKDDSYDLVRGYGKPWGTDYENLEALQGPLTEKTQLLNLGRGIFLRFLEKVPIAIPELGVDDDFYSQKPVNYFLSNSKFLDVKKWVLCDGLFNFATFPAPAQRFVPEVKFTPRYVYVTQSLFISTDIYFKPSVAERPREVYPLSIVTSDWKDEKMKFFLEYKHFPPYMTSPTALTVELTDDSVASAIKKVEAAIDKDVKEQSATTSKAGTAAQDVAVNVSSDVKDFVDKIETPIDTEHKDKI